MTPSRPRTRSCCVLNLVTPFNNYLLPQPRRSCLAQCVPMNSKHPLRYQICLNLAYRGLAPRIEMANRYRLRWEEPLDAVGPERRHAARANHYRRSPGRIASRERPLESAQVSGRGRRGLLEMRRPGRLRASTEKLVVRGFPESFVQQEAVLRGSCASRGPHPARTTPGAGARFWTSLAENELFHDVVIMTAVVGETHGVVQHATFLYRSPEQERRRGRLR